MSREQQDMGSKKTGHIPSSPGVYLMKNKRGEVIYVGKAKNLSSRVTQYFRAGERKDIKTASLVSAVERIDYIATSNEIEALILENTLIKEHRPRYNIQLKGGNRYPYVKLTVNEKFPRLMVVRKIENDGAEYFGPYADVGAVRRTIRFLGGIFPLRTCSNRRLNASDERECLNYHINRCSAPCTGRINEKQYGEMVEQVKLFLQGKNSRLLKNLENQMEQLSRQHRYEEAAVIRDKIDAIAKLSERQLAVSVGGMDEDAVSVAREGSTACGMVMRIREGKILGTEAFILDSGGKADLSDIQDTFIKLYYHTATDIPPLIMVDNELVEKNLLQEWLAGKTGRKTRIERPVRGEKRAMVRLASKNASLKLFSRIKPDLEVSDVLSDLMRIFDLPSYPYSIEAYDISNVQGVEAVGSMVTFVNGKPLKSDYRRFKIRGVDGIDDYAMLSEVLERRLNKLEKNGKRPDLMLIDGGRGQVNATVSALEGSGLEDIPVIGLAKKREEIYPGGGRGKVNLPLNHPVLHLLQRIRDEAHRFAVEYHRKLMNRRLKKSVLDEIEGIGENRKTLLLLEFGSVERIREASGEELSSVKGIGEKYAERIYRYFH